MKNKQFPNIDPMKLKRSDLFDTINKCESDMSRNIAEHLDQNLNHYDEIKNEFYNFYTKLFNQNTKHIVIASKKKSRSNSYYACLSKTTIDLRYKMDNSDLKILYNFTSDILQINDESRSKELIVLVISQFKKMMDQIKKQNADIFEEV